WSRLTAEEPSVLHNMRQYMRSPAPEGLLAFYVTSSEPIRKFAETQRHNSDDHPLLEFHAPRELYSNTRDLNVSLLYDVKSGLLPMNLQVANVQRVYAGMIEPLLHIGRQNLANQAVGLLSQMESPEPGLLDISMARISLDQGNAETAENQLKRTLDTVKPGNPLFADREELWGMVNQKLGKSEEAIRHYEAAAAADPLRPKPPRRLAELNALKQAWKEAAQWMETYTKVEPAATGHELALMGDYFMADRNLDKAQDSLKS